MTVSSILRGPLAKTINLSPLSEPDIYRTTSLFSTVIENMVYDKRTKELDFEDDSLTANMAMPTLCIT